MDAESILISHNVRPTTNRIIVMRALMMHDKLMSIKDFEEKIITLDRSSIFRTLRLFVKHHLIHEVEDGSGALKYELCRAEHCTDHHDDLHPHFFCESCKRTVCLSDMPIPKVSFVDGSIVHSVNFVLKGICGECAGSGPVVGVDEL